MLQTDLSSDGSLGFLVHFDFLEQDLTTQSSFGYTLGLGGTHLPVTINGEQEAVTIPYFAGGILGQIEELKWKVLLESSGINQDFTRMSLSAPLTFIFPRFSVGIYPGLSHIGSHSGPHHFRSTTNSDGDHYSGAMLGAGIRWQLSSTVVTYTEYVAYAYDKSLGGMQRYHSHFSPAALNLSATLLQSHLIAYLAWQPHHVNWAASFKQSTSAIDLYRAQTLSLGATAPLTEVWSGSATVGQTQFPDQGDGADELRFLSLALSHRF